MNEQQLKLHTVFGRYLTFQLFRTWFKLQIFFWVRVYIFGPGSDLNKLAQLTTLSQYTLIKLVSFTFYSYQKNSKF